MSRTDRLRRWWSHAFAVESAADRVIDEEERELIARLADFLARRRLTAPALMALEVGRPLNFVGSQLLVFLSPFMTLIFDETELKRCTRLLEKRCSIDALVDALVCRDSAASPDAASTDPVSTGDAASDGSVAQKASAARGPHG